ncbi:J domain-containing protein [Nitrospina gracilis]|uniref:J domain-containing protein n=1 Tax=Nitrospina gracilis TaxID=35801 RepID=UPI001F4924B4|nr:DnaJ domain-containing protein [Nitrospina gracilis]MCF8720547.1 curved DNA-binding protein CbpA [Nitrospina gracilis Nb-211]
MNATRYVDLPECFQTLNVAEGVSWAEIKKAYYQLAKQYHPDRNPNDLESEDRFKKISIAFGVLERYYRTNPGLRLKWKSNASVEEPAIPPQPDFGSQSKTNGSRQRHRAPNSYRYVKDEDTLRSNGKGYAHSTPPEPEVVPEEDRKAAEAGSPFARRIGRWWNGTYRNLQGLERRVLSLDLEKTVNIESHTGLNGGTVRVRTPGGTFNIRIPAGTTEDIVMRIPEKGERGLLNRKRGDLVLRIQVTSPQAQQSEDFYYQVRVTQKDLSMGQVMILDTHEGPIRYALPKTTVTGQTFSLKVRTDSANPSNCNHIIVVEVVPG